MAKFTSITDQFGAEEIYAGDSYRFVQHKDKTILDYPLLILLLIIATISALGIVLVLGTAIKRWLSRALGIHSSTLP